MTEAHELRKELRMLKRVMNEILKMNDLILTKMIFILEKWF